MSWNVENYCHICNQRLVICLIAKFRVKIRILISGNENTLFGCFGQQFWKTIVIFEISTLEFALLQSFKKIKSFKFGIKNARFACFRVGIWIHYCHIWNQRSQIYLVAKFGAKKLFLNLGPKCLIWVFLGRKLKIILSYLKSAPSNLSNSKISRKN